MLYACRSQHCNKEFLSERALTTHRKSCEFYQRHEIAASKRRKEGALAIRAKRHEALEKVRHRLRTKLDQASLLIKHA
jgi:hypothetical protein